jgi:glycosyltransferase involved in cell wall biosynthesis
MLSVHHALGTWREHVDRYVALSDFGRVKYVEGGFPSERVVVKPNSIADPRVPRRAELNGFLFVGRLAEGKGIEVLLSAIKSVEGCRVTFVGDGPLMDLVRRRAGEDPRIKVLGRLDRDEVYRVMAGASALIFPSTWYEGCPMTIAEAYGCGLPVIGSRLGAVEEMIDDGRTGVLFEAGNRVDLARRIEWARDNPSAIETMSRGARAEYEAKYSHEVGLARLISIYEEAISRRRSSW